MAVKNILLKGRARELRAHGGKKRGDGNIHPFKGYCDDDDVENVDISFSRNTVEFTAAFLP